MTEATNTPALKRILLIRHGQTEWNAEGRWQGTLDVPLSETGREQARALGRYLRGRPIRAIYSSDLSRAAQTAQAVGDALGLPVHYDPRWRELDLGVFQGLTYPEITAKYPAEMAGLQRDYMDYVVPKGESRRRMQQRAFDAFNEILSREQGPEIVVVTHGGPIRVLLMRLLEDDVLPRKIEVYNTSITTVETDGKIFRALGLAETPHLDSVSESRGEARM